MERGLSEEPNPWVLVSALGMADHGTPWPLCAVMGSGLVCIQELAGERVSGFFKVLTSNPDALALLAGLKSRDLAPQ